MENLYNIEKFKITNPLFSLAILINLEELKFSKEELNLDSTISNLLNTNLVYSGLKVKRMSEYVKFQKHLNH